MKYYIKRTLFTVIEAFILTVSLFLLKKYILAKTIAKKIDFVTTKITTIVSPRTLFITIFFILVLCLICFRHLCHKLKLWKILHLSIHRIDKMSGLDFETFLKHQFEKLGFKVEVTKASNDYGADLILHKKNLIIAVQAKRYHSNIGVKAVQEVIGSMAYYEAHKGLVVTNSFFTKNAQALANANNVTLWDREVLIKLLSGEAMTGYINELLKS